MLQDQLLVFALSGVEWVLWLLVGLSVACLAVTIERVFNITVNRTPEAPLRQAMAAFSTNRDIGKLKRALGELRGAEARVLFSGAYQTARAQAGVEEVMTSTTIRERIRMERYLSLLGTVGANAPFIGLFGTVLGIIKAFNDLAMNQAEGASAVMAGISEALVATAVGLLVAIPAVVLYNLFQRHNRRTLARLDSLSQALMAEFKSASARPRAEEA